MQRSHKWGCGREFWYHYSWLWRVGVHCKRTLKGFPSSSAGKESTYNAGDPGSIPGSARSPGEGIGCPLLYSWSSLVAQLVKNLPAKAIHSSILAWRIPWTVESMGSQRVGHDWATFTLKGTGWTGWLAPPGDAVRLALSYIARSNAWAYFREAMVSWQTHHQRSKTLPPHLIGSVLGCLSPAPFLFLFLKYNIN